MGFDYHTSRLLKRHFAYNVYCLFTGKNKEKIINLAFAKFAQRVVKNNNINVC